MQAFKNFEIVAKYARECGTEVVNMLPNFWIECFRKIDLKAEKQGE